MTGRHGTLQADLAGTPGPAAPATRRPDAGRHDHRGVLDLQRLAGNAATARLLHAQREAPKEAAAGGSPAPKDAAQQGGSQPQAGGPEAAWEGHLKTNFGENKNLYHTLNNYGDKQLSYQLEVTNSGYAMVTLGTQFEYQRGGSGEGGLGVSIEDIGRRAGPRRRLTELGGSSTRLEREWFAFGVTRGKTEQSTYGLPPHASLHLRLFGERDYTDPDQSYVEGTLRVRRIK